MALQQPVTVEPPDFTDTVNQQFFIEPQGGPQHPVSYLDAFPETIYNKSLDSNLIALMYTLLGPAGIGALRQNYLEGRLAIEDNGLSTTELDALYAEPFSFARLAYETYEDDTEGLLTNEKWEQIQTSDASYKNRAINYLKAARAGGTLLGLTLAAQSGLNTKVELFENYRALFDKFSDDPLELEFVGVTDSTEEVVVLPRQERPKSSLQVLSILGDPISGEFRLAVPMGANGEGSSGQNTTVTAKIPYNVSARVQTDEKPSVQEALEALTVIGKGNVEVSGGPFPGNPIEVSFTNELADTPIPEILVVENSLGNAEEVLVEIEVTVKQVGVSADGETAPIPPEDWYYAQVAMDNIKPVTTILTPGKSPGITQRQVANSTFSDSEFIEVLKYVTGRRKVSWPPVDSTHWIEGGVEKEAPITQSGKEAHYTNFHNIHAAIAYTDAALLDPDYETALWPTVQGKYLNEQVGPFGRALRASFPYLAKFSNPREQFFATNGPATPPELLTVQAVSGEISLIEGIYPTDYAQFSDVTLPNPSGTTPFWASIERPSGADYIEIDLGAVQAVNAISFDAINTPYDIAVTYDLLDQSPQRRFFPVTYANPQDAPSTLSIGHTSGTPNTTENPWTKVAINFTNALGKMIYTRFIRIEFNRRTGPGSLFTLPNGNLIPYGVQVQNLRIGRNVA